MAVYDLRRDQRWKYELGRDIGRTLASGLREYQKTKVEESIVRTIQQGVAANKTPEEIGDDLRNETRATSTRVNQEVQSLYYRKNLQARTAATEALTRQREEGGGGDPTMRYSRHRAIIDKAQEALVLSIDPEEQKRLKEIIKAHDGQLRKIEVREGWIKTPPGTQPGQPTISDPAAATMEGPRDQLDIRQAFLRPGLEPGKFAQVEKPKPTISDSAAIAMEGPQDFMPPGVQERWESMTPEERTEYYLGKKAKPKPTKADVAIEKELKPSIKEEPPTQEHFEQVVQMLAKTDRAAAKRYYDAWIHLWQQ